MYKHFILLMALCFASEIFSQATTVNVVGTGSTLTITNAVQTPVDPLLTITADGDLTAFTVTISGSYTTGDVLSYTGTLPSGITAAAFNATTRSLVFSGTTTAANWQTLLRTVTITTVSAICFQEQRQVSFVAGNKYYNNLNGHFYENVPGTINWATALAAASTKSYFGRQGYLATMTSLAETNFIWKIIPSDSWMGASDNNVYINAATGTTTYATNTGAGSSDGRWYWVTGPEKGTLFSVGHGTPTIQSGQFAYWNPGEPNGSNGGEDCGQFYAGNGGHWNDLNFSSNLSSYIVEYGGMSTDNVGANVVFTRDLLLLGAPSGTITGGNTNVCSTVNSTTLTLTGLVSGGTVVKWQYSYDDFLTAGIDITNTSTTNTVTNINQNTYYRAVVNTPGCTGLTTSSTRINVDTAVAGNIVADNNTICVNANVNFTLNGNSGNVTKWQVSTSSTFASGITDIANTTSAMSYQLTAAGTYYFRAVIESCSNTVYTAGYTISCIAGTAPAGGTISNASFCNGSNSGTLTLSGYTGSITKWQYSIDGGIVWTDISNTSNTYNFSGITTTRKYRALLTSGSCGTAWSSTGLVTVSSAVPSISYSVSGTQNYMLNSAISSITITNLGGAVSTGNYSVSPALPTGLVLGADGSIDGTPTVTSAVTTYTITGTNSCGSDTASVTISTGATPTISGFSDIDRIYYDGSFTIDPPISNSSGVFSYTSSNTSVATISGAIVTILSAGTTTITANQSADASYTSGSITAILTVSSVEVITKNGQNTTTDTNYVSKNGAIGNGVGITINGEVRPTLTPIPLQNSLHINAANSQYLTFTKPSSLNATGDFTFETWIKFNSIGAGTMDPIFGGGQGDYLSIYSNNFTGRIDVNNPCSADRNFFSSSLLDTTSWHHIAVVRSGSTITAYLNGVAQGTTDCTGTFMNSLSTVYIGRNTWRPGYLDAYISNMRYVVGTAVYTANFTPPTSVLTAIPGTEFLFLANDESFPLKDSSPNNITVNGFGSPILALANGPF
ncbi:LamG-like jellyroll fold domain-containing protein [Flavivirga spongiicola]|uniref:C-type lectin domain-containing protein n=1 Tax=Flavivirga spongiicola TaxID=421621 RepID=A0ABU7XVU1_9FLAO|nr:LamG-like jellyroll fold domain-containing protein [Flavivirga sp. MEBiC05379]MDO5979712.1 LamG-like jellyroll fold domain-containing protein [Flavivirga sp. MEBiC05379]